MLVRETGFNPYTKRDRRSEYFLPDMTSLGLVESLVISHVDRLENFRGATVTKGFDITIPVSFSREEAM